MKLEVVSQDGCRLIAEAHGPAKAPALLFLNSLGCDRRLWGAQVAALEARYRCLIFDARGHGQSDAPESDYTLDLLGRDALAVLDAAEVAQAHVCGLSLGGLVAQRLAIHAPARVATLTLANTASRIGAWDAWEARRRTVLAEGLGAIADMAMERFFSEDFRRAEPDLVAGWRTRLTAGSARGYAGCCAALRDADLTNELGRIAAPTLVIGGRLDVSTPPEATDALAKAIPGARSLVLDAAHLSNLEQPQAFTEALRMHLEAA